MCVWRYVCMWYVRVYVNLHLIELNLTFAKSSSPSWPGRVEVDAIIWLKKGTLMRFSRDDEMLDV
jgi:hypothetical protein